MKIKDKILQIRKLAQLTQAEFAQKLSITRQTVINWEKGITEPSTSEYSGIVQTFDIDLNKLTIEATEKETIQIPFYDAVAVGGLAMLADQNPVQEPTEMINPGTWFKSASGALRVYGHSMFPKYPAGCIVAFKASVKDVPSVIVWGEDYVIELEDRRILKRLEKCDTPGCVKAVSYNVNKDQKYVYDPIEIPLSEIKRLYIVLGKIELETSI